MQTRFGRWHQIPGASLSLVLAVLMVQAAQAESALAQRLDAARQTARQPAPCVAAQPSYWRVGMAHPFLFRSIKTSSTPEVQSSWAPPTVFVPKSWAVPTLQRSLRLTTAATPEERG